MQRKVVATWFPESFVDPGVLDAAGIPFELTFCALHDEDAIIEAAREADAVVIPGFQRYPRRVLEQLERCRHIAAVGIGYDGIDVAAATELGICVSNNPLYCVDEVVEHTLALLLALARRIIPSDRFVKTGRWTRLVTQELQTEVLGPIRRLSTLTLGVVGLGNTGDGLARRARALGLRVIACTPPSSAERARRLEIPLVSLDQLLREADFVSLHAALTNETRGMIGRAELGAMKPTAYLLNTARGGLVDQDALLAALAEGTIAGAAIDVMEPEPLPADSPLLQLDNVIITPHCAYFSQESIKAQWRNPCEEAVRVLNGEWPLALVNPAVKERYVEKWGPMR